MSIHSSFLKPMTATERPLAEDPYQCGLMGMFLPYTEHFKVY